MKVAELDELFFMKENIVDVNAATIGTSINRLECINKDEADEALEIMKAKRFDVLPIKSSNSLVKEYFQTKDRNNYSTLPERKTIIHKDFIPLQTHIRDLIKSFASESRLFYLLSNEHRIAGIVTIADLNHRQVRTYLFSLLSELEILLSYLIYREKINEKELLDINYEENNKMIRRDYENDKTNEVEVSFVEYLYLPNLLQIIKERDLYSKLGYNNKENFDGDFKNLREFRNKVMHSNRSIVINEDSVKSLRDRIEQIECALFKLRHSD